MLAFGGGNVVGSVFGGISSDRVLKRLKEANDGISLPQVCLFFLLSSLPLTVLAPVPATGTVDEYSDVRATRGHRSLVRQFLFLLNSAHDLGQWVAHLCRGAYRSDLHRDVLHRRALHLHLFLNSSLFVVIQVFPLFSKLTSSRQFW